MLQKRLKLGKRERNHDKQHISIDPRYNVSDIYKRVYCPTVAGGGAALTRWHKIREEMPLTIAAKDSDNQARREIAKEVKNRLEANKN